MQPVAILRRPDDPRSRPVVLRRRLWSVVIDGEAFELRLRRHVPPRLTAHTDWDVELRRDGQRPVGLNNPTYRFRCRFAPSTSRTALAGTLVVRDQFASADPKS